MTTRFAVAVAATIASMVGFAAAEITDNTPASIVGTLGIIAGTFAVSTWYPAGWKPRAADARFYVLMAGVMFYLAVLTVVEAVMDGDLAGGVFPAAAFAALTAVVLAAAFRKERREE